MMLLIRPYSTRLIGGVCAAIAERFGLNVWLVRALIVCAMIPAPIVLLLYLIAWLSIPGEVGAVAGLQLRDSEPIGADRFARLASTLLSRTGLKGRQSANARQSIAFLLLLLAFVLQMPKVEGQNFYYLHPIFASIFALLSRFSGVAFYLVVALLFYVRTGSGSSVALSIESSNTVELEAEPGREIGGLVAGISRVTNTQPSVLRLLLVFLNIMTFGLVAIIYGTLVWLLRRERRVRTPTESNEQHAIEPEDELIRAPLRALLGSLFLLLAIIRLSTEVRLFFFNEPFFQGIVLIIAGIITAWSAIQHRHKGSRENLVLVIGSAVMLTGIYELSTAIFRVQLSLGDRFVVAYLILGLAFLYFTAVSLRGLPQRVGLGIVVLLFLAAAFVEFSFAPSRYLLALVEFYDFFYPILFAGFGLWLVMEK